MKNALSSLAIDRDLGFCYSEASLDPFWGAMTVHNRKSLPFLAKSGHDLGRASPFGLVMEEFVGGVVEMGAEKPV